jgi:hypothetical protein
MKRKIKIIIKRIENTTKLSYKDSAIFVINSFKDNGFLYLTAKQKKFVLYNFLICFDAFCGSIENPKIRSKSFQNDEVLLNWCIEKLDNIVCLSQHIRLYN